MKPEEVFGMNAGKVWNVLKSKGMLTALQISKEAGLKITDVFGALGWLGREGKLEIVEEKKKVMYKLKE